MTPKTDLFTHSDHVSKHLLVETALLDSSKFDILSIDEVGSLKKEKQKVDGRIESARRKLAMESKVRDAAQSLHRLYTANGRPKSQRRQSLLGGERRGSGSSNQSNSASQAGDELASSNGKIDELLQILVGLENRRQYIESRLLRHTAAVLQAAHSEREAEMSQSLQDSGFDDDNTMPYDKNYAESIHSLNQLANGLGIRNSLKGFAEKRNQADQDRHLSDVNMRLQALNGQMRTLISQAKKGRASSIDDTPDDVPSAYPEDEDAAIRLDHQLHHMQNSIITLLGEHQHMRESRDSGISDAKQELHTLETRIENANNQLYTMISNSADTQSIYDTQPPPEISGHGAAQQIKYLEETLLTVEQIMQQSDHLHDSHNYLSKEMEDLRLKSESHSERAAQYETTVTGLWDILSHDDHSPRSSQDGQRDADGNVQVGEPFSLQAFSNKVQHLFERVNQLDLHTDTLRRQIQQQRDLAGKADAEKVSVIELEEAKAREQDALQEVEEQRSRIEELQDHIAEVEAKLSEHQDDARIAETEMQAKEHDHRLRLEELTASLEHANMAKEQAEGRLQEKDAEIVTLESEVVRLTTELTMAKAELDGAYGSRTDRAKDVANNPAIQAQLVRLNELTEQNERMMGEMEQLRMDKLAQGNDMQELDEARMRVLEKELADMAADYQHLTREAVEVEKEREKVEALVDTLRVSIEGLETQLSDEKVRWLGVQRSGTPEPGAREMTSTMVMRTEFKKMMRETRAEAVRMLRAEQEERRRLETQIRSMRRANALGLSPSPSLRP
ncbi:Up-regulated during septation-domain-containing protein [Delphinella strobiligena]|nr:Up-regulated during septation-domain-containing protein [Delphinella strobiligena]